MSCLHCMQSPTKTTPHLQSRHLFYIEEESEVRPVVMASTLKAQLWSLGNF